MTGKPEKLRKAYMNMLDPTAIANPSAYTKDDIKTCMCGVSART